MASILQFIWPLPDKGLSKRLYRLKAPTLLVWGAQDGLVHPAYGEDFRDAHRRRPASRSSTAPGTSRSWSRPSTTIGLITDFLRTSAERPDQLRTATPTVSAAAKPHHTR